MQNKKNEISMSGLTGKLLRNEPMSKHSSWRTGGVAAWFYTPSDVEDLGIFLKRVPAEMPILWCGLGSNMLVRDGGFEGVVVSTLKGLNRIELAGDHCVYAEAGVTCSKTAKFSVNHSLSGSEFLAGVPGTIGGALAMNAGCFGQETWEIVKFADTISRSSTQRSRDAGDVEFGYRYCNLAADEWFTGAEFNLTSGNRENGRVKIKNLLRKRAGSQPIQTANAGSVFKNPPDNFAARLLESAGLKNYSIGEARISPKHANFIENTGQATAIDIEMLIEHAIDQVESVHGIRLQPEVRIVGTA